LSPVGARGRDGLKLVEKIDGRLRGGGGISHTPDALFALIDKLGE